MKGLREDCLAELSHLYPVWEKKTIWTFFGDTAKLFPEREFIVAEGRGSYTYRQTYDEVLRIARALTAAGVRPGDHVAMQIENCPEQVFTALAVTAVRAVKVAVNTSLATKELHFVLRQSESQYLITSTSAELKGDETTLRQVIALPGADPQTVLPVLEWEEFLAAGEGAALPDSEGEAHADEVSDIIYTSGSTKAPKGVMLTHDMLMRSAYASCMNRAFEIGRRIFVPLPMFHVYGYVEGMLAAILVGGAVLLRRGKFEARPALEFMAAARANDILSVPSQMMALIHVLDEEPRQFPDLHAVYCSASICPAWVWPGIRRALGVADVITGYGMTEVCGASMQTAPEDPDEILMSRVGKLLPGGCAGFEALGGHQLEYRVVDAASGRDCAPGEIGELWCRGAVVTGGYYNRPEANRRVLTDDGWFKTGDCGSFDEAGYLILAGRIDDMYKINGENVSPKFLEDVLGSCPEINEVAVAGIKDEKHGYVGAAFLELHEDTLENRQRAESYARAHLAKFQIPKYYIYMSAADWPRTATGKVQRFRLKEIGAARAAGKD